VLAADDLTTRDFPPDAVPDDLVADPQGRILAGPVGRGEPLTTLRLVGAGLTEGHPELRAVPLRLPDAGMADLLQVGDRIDLVVTDPQRGTAAVVAAGVTVLALPHAEAAPSTTGLAGSLVVVGVDPVDVEEISGAAVTGFLTYAFSR
jgi:Flp pilus assembly protein CpaB